MVQQNKQTTPRDKQAQDTPSSKKQNNMSAQKKDAGGMSVHKQTTGSTKKETRATNGHTAGFRTDTAISSTRNMGASSGERELKPWKPDDGDAFGGALESSSSIAGWDQFADHEARGFEGSTYDESFYTTAINKNAPDYQAKLAYAERKEREILRSAANNSHVREERTINLQGKDDNGQDEEDKYSGVLESDFPPLGNADKSNRYVAPARRMPTGSSTVKGAPVDPAIISAQLSRPKAATPVAKPSTESQTITDTVKEAGNKEAAIASAKTTNSTTAVPPTAAPLPAGPTNATATVATDVFTAFKAFAGEQRDQVAEAEKARERVLAEKQAHDRASKLRDLKKFATTFTLKSAVPEDLIPIIAKDPVKQREIAEKSKLEQEQRAVSKQSKPDAGVTSLNASPAPIESGGMQQSTVPSMQASQKGYTSQTAQLPQTMQSRQQSNGHNFSAMPQGSQQMMQGQHFQRGNHAYPAQSFPTSQQQQQPQQQQRNVAPQSHAQRNRPYDINNGNRFNNGTGTWTDNRPPVSMPSNNADNGFSRRSSGATSLAKLNPNIQEFRPSASAQPFSPVGSTVITPNPVNMSATPTRKPFVLKGSAKPFIKADFDILARLSVVPPPTGSESKLKAYTANGELQPAYDTLPTWKAVTGTEPADAIINTTYTQLLSKPNMPDVSPSRQQANSMATYQHQLPFHLQQGAPHSRNVQRTPMMQSLAQTQSPNGHFNNNNNDDHRMVASHSSHSFASPRMQQVNMAYVSPMGQSGQVFQNAMPYQSGGPQIPQMPQMNYRAYPHAQINGQVPVPIAYTQTVPFMSPGAQMVPAPMFQNGPMMTGVPTGYASPGRIGAPMMQQQGSQQGHQMGQMPFQPSPGMGYQTPVYAQGPPGQMTPMRSYSNQQYNGSPMQRQYSQGNRGGGNFNRMAVQAQPGQSPMQTAQPMQQAQAPVDSPSQGEVDDNAK